MKNIFIASVFFGFVGCVGSDSGSEVSLVFANSLGPHNWQANCEALTSGSVSLAATFASGSYTSTANLSSNSTCTADAARFLEAGTYTDTAIDSSGQGTVDFTLQALDIIPLTVLQANSFNTSTFCGYSDWQSGVVKSILGRTCNSSVMPTAGAVRYDLYKIAQLGDPFGHSAGDLLFGSSSGGNDGTTPSKRPTAIDGTVVYKEY